MPTIQLTQGQRARVDWEDYRELNQHKWYALWSNRTKSFYAVRGTAVNGRKTTEYMHRRILNLKHGDQDQGDHKNHDTLDNRKRNLRVATCRQNHENRRDQSKYGPGISKSDCSLSRPFRAMAHRSGRRIMIGNYATADEATQARAQYLKTGKKPPPRRPRSPYGTGIKKDNRCPSRPFQARVHSGSREIHIGSFATAEEARQAREAFLNKK